MKLLGFGRALAQLITLCTIAPVAHGERVALVIGNATYSKLLVKNPLNDARAMAKALDDLGFDVILVAA